MKTQKFIVIAAIVCLLVGASGGAAMAEGCGDGVLENETFEGNLVITDELSCSIIGSTIEGNLRVRDTFNVLLLNNKVGGSIRVIRTEGEEGLGVANVLANTVFSGNLVVNEYATANVIENETLAGTIRVNGNTEAIVQKNIAAQNLICRGNTTLSSFINFAGDTLSCE
jgi:hypothetical protein